MWNKASRSYPAGSNRIYGAMMQFFCQLLLLSIFVVGFFIKVYYVMNGRPAKDQGSYEDFVHVAIAFVLHLFTLYGAGALTHLW